METTSVPATATTCDDPDHGDLYDPECPCRDILDLVSSKWAALVIGKLEERPHRFGELRRAVGGISQKMLTQTLRRLEQDGLVLRTVHAEFRPPQVEYSLTELGTTVSDPLAVVRQWAEDHLADVLAARQAYEQANPS